MKPLKDLTRDEYVSALDSGMFWEWYPEATGSYTQDCGEEVASNHWWKNTQIYEIEVKIKVVGSTLEDAQRQANELLDDINELRESKNV